jgi:hypothetical protein
MDKKTIEEITRKQPPLLDRELKKLNRIKEGLTAFIAAGVWEKFLVMIHNPET